MLSATSLDKTSLALLLDNVKVIFYYRKLTGQGQLTSGNFKYLFVLDVDFLESPPLPHFWWIWGENQNVHQKTSFFLQFDPSSSKIIFISNSARKKLLFHFERINVPCIFLQFEYVLGYYCNLLNSAHFTIEIHLFFPIAAQTKIKRNRCESGMSLFEWKMS